MSDEISGARLDDTLDDLDKMAKGEVRAHADIRAVGEDGAWTVRALRAENARLRGELAAHKSAFDRALQTITEQNDELGRASSHEVCTLHLSESWHEIDRLRSWLRALEYRSPDSVRAALRGDDAPEGGG